MIPLSLYIHIPWCIRKCPYCDFNSHVSPDNRPEDAYIDALIADFHHDFIVLSQRNITSIFIGGGTPSLFSAESYARLFETLRASLTFSPNIEITLEANPGSVDRQRFIDYRAIGINRLSLGIQSFDATHLKTLGRIHDEADAHNAIEHAQYAGFDNINIDIMYGLPHQSVMEGLRDLNMALAHNTTHLSWYQLTIEPNTVFYKTRPPLPSEDETEALELAGLALLADHNYQRYEISAFSKDQKIATHNLNYWLFGDYLGIGAGAHSKLTCPINHHVTRTHKHRQPNDYLNPNKPFLAGQEHINPNDLVFEFMLNTTRLEQPIAYTLFTERTGLPLDRLKAGLLKAEKKGLITCTDTHWFVTPFGRRYTNDLQALFLS